MKSLFKNIAEKWQMRTKWSELTHAERVKGGLIMVTAFVIGTGVILLPSMVNSHPDVNSTKLDSSDTSIPTKTVTSKNALPATDENAVGFKVSDDIESQKKRRDTDKLTVADIIEGYLNNDPAVTDLYSECSKDYAGWIYIKDKGTYYPGAVYDGDWKDVVAVLQSYRNKSQPWVEAQSEPINMTIWTKNYRHQFVIEEDWLTLDHIRVMPVVEKTYNLSPDTLIDRYQAGKWNGQKIYSSDYWTTATINPQYGFIEYNYSRQLAEDYDYERSKSYNVIHHELVYRPEETHGPAYKDWDVVIDKEIEEYYFNREVGGAYSNQYVDLPNGRIDEEIFDSWYCEDGTFLVLKNNEIRLYKKGELIASWSGFTLSDDAFIMINDEKEKFFYSNDEVFLLQDGGALEKLMDNIFYVYNSYEGSLAFAALNDGVVTYGSNMYYDDPFRVIEIERNVTDAIGEMGRIFMKKDDGTARIWDTDGDLYKEYVTYLLDGFEARSWLKGTEYNYTDKERVNRFKTFMKDIIKAEKAAEEAAVRGIERM